MKGSLKIGRVFGIAIQLHYSWFIIFVLITFGMAWSLYDVDPADREPLWACVATGIATSLLLFGSVVAHELAHSLVAIRNGIPVRSITLFFLGGMAQITREATKPKTELLVALAGPACSLVIAGVMGLVWYLVWGHGDGGDSAPSYMVFWLAWINLLLGLFNLIPGFPLDGGRVLRAVLWRRTGDYRRASLAAATVGRGVAYLMIGAGVVTVFLNVLGKDINPFNGIWLAIIGVFLHQTATASYRQVEMRESLRSLLVRSVMLTDFLAVYPSLSLRALAQGHAAGAGSRLFVVNAQRELLGLVTVEDLKSVPETLWDATPVSAVMLPASKMPTVTPKDDAITVMERMEEEGVNEIAVVVGRVLVGVVLRHRLLHLMKLRSELGV